LLAIAVNFGLAFIFGREYLPAISITLVLLFSAIFMVPFKSLNADLAGEGKPKYAIFTMFPSVLLNIGLNLLLIPKMGAVGAAVSTMLSYILCGFLISIIYSNIKAVSLSNLLLIKRRD